MAKVCVCSMPRKGFAGSFGVLSGVHRVSGVLYNEGFVRFARKLGLIGISHDRSRN